MHPSGVPAADIDLPAFSRVLIVGGRHFHNYATLRVALDALLANRLPDVGLLTADGRGVPMLAASYATELGVNSREFARIDSLTEFSRAVMVNAIPRHEAENARD